MSHTNNLSIIQRSSQIELSYFAQLKTILDSRLSQYKYLKLFADEFYSCPDQYQDFINRTYDTMQLLYNAQIQLKRVIPNIESAQNIENYSKVTTALIDNNNPNKIDYYKEKIIQIRKLSGIYKRTNDILATVGHMLDQVADSIDDTYILFQDEVDDVAKDLLELEATHK